MNERAGRAMRIVRRMLGMAAVVRRGSWRTTASMALFPIGMPFRIFRAARDRWRSMLALGGTFKEVTAELAEEAVRKQAPPRIFSKSVYTGQRGSGGLSEGADQLGPTSAGRVAASHSVDEQTIRHIAERQAGGTSSSESVQQFRIHDNPGGTHRRARKDRDRGANELEARGPEDTEVGSNGNGGPWDEESDWANSPRPDGGLRERRSGAS